MSHFLREARDCRAPPTPVLDRISRSWRRMRRHATLEFECQPRLRIHQTNDQELGDPESVPDCSRYARIDLRIENRFARSRGVRAQTPPRRSESSAEQAPL